ncbi:hypothetical protein Moror_631 [Moniliophthora roreri MCA 2997]|uniref:Uncharacterized protein n=1 Tax=Moniliophthora roreri (strain MCA 2997) TaxID=1381753 RepID=V2WD04_MONRO|nr:hypothetical protein Moror_631 [Moniliophthora roreri MCA 2997]
MIVNLALTLLTAGRIWWIHRQVRAHGVHTSDKTFSTVSRLILESGSLYPLISIIGLILVNVPQPYWIPIDCYPLSSLTAGIAPTLIMVRAKLGKNVESLQEHVSDIRFTSRPAPRESQVQANSIGNFTTTRVDVQGGGE